MWDLDFWQSVGIVCGGILALLTLAAMIYRKLVRPMWRAAWRTIKRLNQVADDLLGDEAKRIPSMTARMASLEVKFDEHLSEWHTPRQRANGAPPVDVRTRRAGR